jgi:hypothetical protein
MMRRMTDIDTLPPELPSRPLSPLAAPPAAGLGLGLWLREGWRAGWLQRARVAGQQPSAGQVLAVAVLTSLVWTALARLQMVGPALFDAQIWLASWWSTAATVWLVWWALPAGAASAATADAERPSGVPAWMALYLVALLPVEFVVQGLTIAGAHGVLPDAVTGNVFYAWGAYLLYWGWALAVAVRLVGAFGASHARVAGFGWGLALVFALSAWQFNDPFWTPDRSGEARTPPMILSQEVIESQQKVLADTLAAIAPERPGVLDVYGLVYAPYAAEDVFKRESTLVAKVLGERFDAKGRTVQLLNHPTTAETLGWATPANLDRAIDALSQRMDRDNDVLVVYLTSHGASDFQLAAEHWPLSVQSLTPQHLRAALDRAGIRNRVIAVSACFSGGWIEPLATDTTLVMTAADATHTSYGCGRKSELTFFGRAMFDEQLRQTYSFEQAFATAVPLIRQREVDAGKPDGFSNPQIRVGAQIRPVLKALEDRLARKP